MSIKIRGPKASESTKHTFGELGKGTCAVYPDGTLCIATDDSTHKQAFFIYPNGQVLTWGSFDEDLGLDDSVRLCDIEIMVKRR